MNKALILFVLALILGAIGISYFINMINDSALGKSTTQLSGTSATGSQAISPTAAIPTPTLGELLSAKKAVIETSKGDITIELYPDVAPQTVSNFIQKANSKYYNNLTFHRVEDWVLQGGDPDGNGTGGGDMPSELSDKPFVRGSLGVARTPLSKEISNDSQFFITKQDASHLDGDYTNFGIVTDGMDIVDEMEIGDKIISISIED